MPRSILWAIPLAEETMGTSITSRIHRGLSGAKRGVPRLVPKLVPIMRGDVAKTKLRTHKEIARINIPVVLNDEVFPTVTPH